jgi:hypothetical protein
MVWSFITLTFLHTNFVLLLGADFASTDGDIQRSFRIISTITDRQNRQIWSTGSQSICLILF